MEWNLLTGNDYKKKSSGTFFFIDSHTTSQQFRVQKQPMLYRTIIIAVQFFMENFLIESHLKETVDYMLVWRFLFWRLMEHEPHK